MASTMKLFDHKHLMYLGQKFLNFTPFGLWVYCNYDFGRIVAIRL